MELVGEPDQDGWTWIFYLGLQLFMLQGEIFHSSLDCSSGAIGQRAVLISSYWCKICGGCEFKPHLEHFLVLKKYLWFIMSFNGYSDMSGWPSGLRRQTQGTALLP